MVKTTMTTKTPDEVGMNYTLWTSKVICEYIQKIFQIKYAERSMRDLMKRLGFSSQKPIARAYKRDPGKISKWLEEDYPKIKILASQEGLVFTGQMVWVLILPIIVVELIRREE